MANGIVNIPGFYYDEEKRRYFKITNQSTSTSEIKYHREEIEKRTREHAYGQQQEKISKLRSRNVAQFENNMFDITSRFFPSSQEFYEFSDGEKIRGSQEEMVEGHGFNIISNVQHASNFIQKGGIWSNLTPVIGNKVQSAERVIISAQDDAIIVITDCGNIVWVHVDGSIKYIYRELEEVRNQYEILKVQLEGNKLFVHRKFSDKNTHSFLTVLLNSVRPNLDIRVHGPLIIDLGNTSVFDTVSDEYYNVFTAKHGAIDIFTSSTQSIYTKLATVKSGRRSDILSIKLTSLINSSLFPGPLGWFACRDGSLYELYQSCKTNMFSARLHYQFKSNSILTIEEIGNHSLLISSPGESAQILRVISKRAVESHNKQDIRPDPTTTILKTTLRNFTKDTEIFNVANEGRTIVYGSRTANGGIGDFEVFSLVPGDNFVQDFDERTGIVSYYPIKTMRECFSGLSLSSIQKIVQVGVNSGPKSSEENSSIDSSSPFQMPIRARLIMLTEDKDIAGSTLRAIDIM